MADDLVEGLPPGALVLLVGPSGSGKSTWAGARFAPEAILSSDAFRAQVAGDAADQSASGVAFRELHACARARLGRGLVTVVDATNLTPRARRSLLSMAGKAGRPSVAVAFDTSLERCLAQNVARPDRQVPEEVVRRHHRQMQRAMAQLPSEGFAVIEVLRDREMRHG